MGKGTLNKGPKAKHPILTHNIAIFALTGLQRLLKSSHQYMILPCVRLRALSPTLVCFVVFNQANRQRGLPWVPGEQVRYGEGMMVGNQGTVIALLAAMIFVAPSAVRAA